MEKCVRIFRSQDSQYAGDILNIKAEKLSDNISLFDRIYCACMAVKLVWRVTK